MKKHKVDSTFVNTEGALTLLWATLQQLVVAASTYFIIEAIRRATANQYDSSVRYVFAFVASLILVYGPNTASLLYLQKWRLESFARFVRLFVESNSGQSTWAHARDKARHESWLTNEASAVYENCTSLIYQLVSAVLSAAFNVLVIAMAIDRRILAWYFIAGIFLAFAAKGFKKRIAATSADAQRSRKILSDAMLSGWDNVFIGNRHTLTNWVSRFERSLNEAKVGAVRYDVTRSLVSSVTVSAALVIISIGNGVYYFENHANLAALAALIITLPRQIQVVQSIFIFFNVYLGWEGAYKQLAQLRAVIDIGSTKKDLMPYVRMESLLFVSDGQSKSYSMLQDVIADVSSRKNGRITIRGKNGAGKSTLLAALSEATGEKSFFLPSNYSELAFTDATMASQSDGSRILTIFRELNEAVDAPYLLLDEWDANLDSENIQRVNELIERLSTKRVVLEARHRVQ